MVKLFGKEYTRDEILARVGDISQIAGVRQCTLDDGAERGVRVLGFRTGSGLEFTVVADRGLDISSASFKGSPLAWRSSTSDVSPAFYEQPGLGWLRSFAGGLVTTCGFTTAGAPGEDAGEQLGLHGRASNLPASNVYVDAEWDGDSYVMWVQGRTRETRVFGENIELFRRITARLGESRILIEDRVTNLGYYPSEHMMLYHCNMGFPVVDEGSRLVGRIAGYTPRDAEAEKDRELYDQFSAPTEVFREKVYYLDAAEDTEGYASAAVINRGFADGQGLGVYVKYRKKELPVLVEWKCIDRGTYVVGLEPANCGVQGRALERERGTLQFLQPGESREYRVELGVLASPDDIRQYEDSVRI